MTLASLIRKAKVNILWYLRKHGSCERRELEAYVFNQLNMRETRDGRVIHETKGIHVLASILAYKELESEGQIKIHRGADLPFPMTDFESLFSLG